MRFEMNILAMARGKERYVFLYDDESHDELLRVLDRFADDDRLNFSSADAAVLTEKIRDSADRAASQLFGEEDE